MGRVLIVSNSVAGGIIASGSKIYREAILTNAVLDNH
jgi:hypothetical protein